MAKRRQGTRTELGQTLRSNELEVGQARDIVAHKAGLSSITYQRAEAIIDKGKRTIKRKRQERKNGTDRISHREDADDTKH